MNILEETKFVERFQFFNGQRLFASDLQGVNDFNRQMRWLHNRSLHQAGIGSGFGVYGQKGDRQITINPGYALDYLGREIVLTHQQVLPIPPVAGDGNGNSAFYALTVSYPDDSALEEAETREAICAPGQAGAIRLREEPLFCWIQLTGDQGQPMNPKSKADLHSNLKIRLANIEVLSCQLNQPPSGVQRCNARPDCGPYIRCGKVSLSKFHLKVASMEEKDSGGSNFGAISSKLGVALWSGPTRIDTSQARFLTIPNYSANFQGERIFNLDPRRDVYALDLLRIETPSAGYFDVSIIITFVGLFALEIEGNPIKSGSSKLDTFIAKIKAEWSLVWNGIAL